MADLIEHIRDSVIGADTAVTTPFGVRRVTYADYTASGRSLTIIEDFITDHVLPMYANTHTETSGTGLQTTRFREEARSTIRSSVGGNADEHAVIFAGSGMTGAIDRLITILGMRIPAELDDRYGFSEQIPADERPVVFVGPYEHHSNELPWRESIADVIEIAEDADGYIDLADLEQRLVEYSERPLIIGSFSAASNVTGIISNTSAVSSILHHHGALSFWDFAAAGPYVQIEMRSPATHGEDYKDAIFLSPHKFIGGPGTPGVLVARRDLLHNRVPAVPGGGTVEYVNPTEHRYLADAEHREEGGTPAIIESIRAGLVFKLKETVGAAAIQERESQLTRAAIGRLSQHPRIEILGNPDAHRLSIVSFVIKAPDGHHHLHHNYVVALLNDLFGIQARGGCSCAGPYGHRLLGIDDETSHRYEHEIAMGCAIVKPGWVRVNFNYFITDDELDFIVEAITIIAEDGWRLLSQYEFETTSGEWKHRDGTPTPPMSLDDLTFGHRGAEFEDRRLTESPERLPEYLAEARHILATADIEDIPTPDLPESAETLRWFLVPADVA